MATWAYLILLNVMIIYFESLHKSLYNIILLVNNARKYKNETLVAPAIVPSPLPLHSKVMSSNPDA